MNKIYNCSFCNKNYASSSSLGNHNRRFHKDKKSVLVNKTSSLCHHGVIISSSLCHHCLDDANNEKIKKYICEYCGKSYKYRQGKYTHLKKCKKSEELTNSKQGDTINIRNSNNNTISNNQTTNNNYKPITIVDNSIINFHDGDRFVKEVISTLTDNQIKYIMTGYIKDFVSKFLNITLFGNYDKFKNIFITNNISKYCFVYENGKFIEESKEVCIELLEERTQQSLEGLCVRMEDKMSDKNYNKYIENMDNINPEEKYIDPVKNKEYKNFKEFNIHEMKLLLYKNQNIVKSVLLTNRDITPLENEIAVKKLKEYSEVMY